MEGVAEVLGCICLGVNKKTRLDQTLRARGSDIEDGGGGDTEERSTDPRYL